jgi:hypothetical protein
MEPIEAALGLLPDRTLWKWKVAHLLLTAQGLYICLDLNTAHVSLDALKERIVELVSAMKPSDPLPVADAALWQRYVAAEFLPPAERLLALRELGLTRARQLLLVTRQEK